MSFGKSLHEYFILDSFDEAAVADYPGAVDFFEDSINVGGLSEREQADMLSSIFKEVSADPTSGIMNHYSKLHCFVKHLGDDPERNSNAVIICKEARQVLGERASSSLRDVHKTAGRLLASTSAKGKSSFQDACIMLRSAMKMYAFVICHLLRSKCPVSNSVSTSQPSALARRAAAKQRPRKASSTPADEDESGLPSVTREACVTALNEFLSSDLKEIWEPASKVGGQMETPAIQLVLRAALHMASQKNNIDGIDAGGSTDSNPVAMGLLLLLGSLVSKYTLLFCQGKWQAVRAIPGAAADGDNDAEPQEEAAVPTSASSNGINSLDVVIAPLLQILTSAENPVTPSRFILRLITMVDDVAPRDTVNASTHEGTISVADGWAYVFLGTFMGAISNMALNEVSGDGPASKAISQLLEDIASHRTSIISIFGDAFIHPLLSAEGYDIRKSAMTCVAELVIQKLHPTGSPSAVGIASLPQVIRAIVSPDHADDPVAVSSPESTELMRNACLKDLWLRMRDLNVFARLHCIKLWSSLVSRRVVPRAFYAPVAAEAVGRISDRFYLVRRAAIKLVEACLRAGWYGSVMQLDQLQSHHADQLEAGKARFTQEMALRPLSDEPRPSFDDFLAAQRAIAAKRDENALNGVTDVELFSAAVKADLKIVGPILHCERTIAFAERIGEALVKATDLLDSKTPHDVVESVSFIVACVQCRVDNAIPAAIRSFSLAYSEELTVRQAVCKAFSDIFFALPQLPPNSGVSLMTLNLARAHRMISVAAYADEGGYYAMEEILEAMRKETAGRPLVDEKLLHAVIEVISNAGGDEDGANSPASVKERRVGMRVYCMLVGTNPRDVQRRMVELLHLMDVNRHDNVFLAHCFASLSREAKVPGFIPVENRAADDSPSGGFDMTHPVLKRAVSHLCRKTGNIGSWCFMASKIIEYVHTIMSTPSKLYALVVNFLARAVQEEYAHAAGSTAPLETIVKSPTADFNRIGQLFFLLGQTAVKHLVTIDNNEREQMRQIDERAVQQKQASPKGGRTSGGEEQVDVMHKELGLATTAHERYQLQEACTQAKVDMLRNPASIWSQYAGAVSVFLMTNHSKRSNKDGVDPVVAPAYLQLRSCAVASLAKLCVASEEFCNKHLKLMFTILSSPSESWVVKTNTITALGDLLCMYPNALEPYLSLEVSGFYALLQDPDVRVRSVTVQVCTFLVLNDMLKVRDHLHTIVRLVADEDPTIASNATQFVHHLAVKQRRHIGNLVPPLLPQLSSVMATAPFQLAMRVLLEKIEDEKAIEGLIDKLCGRFTRYVDPRSASKDGAHKRAMAHNLAFCIGELADKASERTMRRLLSETCYAKYKQWLRDPVVYECFQQIATRAKRSNPGGAERRDKAAIEEWEMRLQADASVLAPAGRNSGNAEDEEDSDEESSQEHAPAEAPAADSESSDEGEDEKQPTNPKIEKHSSDDEREHEDDITTRRKSKPAPKAKRKPASRKSN